MKGKVLTVIGESFSGECIFAGKVLSKESAGVPCL